MLRRGQDRGTLAYVYAAVDSQATAYLSHLETLQVSLRFEPPPSPSLPLIVFADPAFVPREILASSRYCLAITPTPTPEAQHPHVTYLSGTTPEQFGVSVQDWLAWAELDAQEPLEASQLLGRSPAFCQFVGNLRAAARSDAATLLTGETGTGKEVAARAIHYWSRRRGKPFVAVNCGGQNDDLFINELFGHERGAFTGAKDRKDGLIEAANGGTLFLDEINSLSAHAQAALLRFIQDQTYRPLGSRRTVQADVRVVSATNQPLRELAAGGKFRADLFYRLEVLSVPLPTLRSRQQDVPVLARHFLERLCERYGTTRREIASETMRQLVAHEWPGNVRELENYLHRLFALSDGNVLQARATGPTSLAGESLSARVTALPPRRDEEGRDDAAASLQPFQDAKDAAIEHFERTYLQRLLCACDGNISRAARMAGKERRTFSRLIQKHGLRAEYRDQTESP